ncbi:hypothetical protein D3C75_1317490 [compost metagenome]
MLVHHGSHLAGAHIIALGRHHTGPVTQQRHRQTGVIGYVAFAKGDHRKAGLGQRLHVCPDFQRRAQALL